MRDRLFPVAFLSDVCALFRLLTAIRWTISLSDALTYVMQVGNCDV
jgi:hypothetical protein